LPFFSVLQEHSSSAAPALPAALYFNASQTAASATPGLRNEAASTSRPQTRRKHRVATREAVQAANTNAAVDDCPAGTGADLDTIIIPAGVYTLRGAADEDANASGDLDILNDGSSFAVVLTGAGDGDTFLQACEVDQLTEPCPEGLGSADRVVHSSGGGVVLENLTVRNGLAGDGGGVRAYS
jgi:hypothetical protein